MCSFSVHVCLLLTTFVVAVCVSFSKTSFRSSSTVSLLRRCAIAFVLIHFFLFCFLGDSSASSSLSSSLWQKCLLDASYRAVNAATVNIIHVVAIVFSSNVSVSCILDMLPFDFVCVFGFAVASSSDMYVKGCQMTIVKCREKR